MSLLLCFGVNSNVPSPSPAENERKCLFTGVGDVHPSLVCYKYNLSEKSGISYKLFWINNFIVLRDLHSI